MRQSLAALGVKGSFLLIKHNQPWLDYATANRTDTSYLINSVQKSMTATMIMRAVQAHRLSLNDPLARYYRTIPGAKRIKVGNLLNMSSGLDLKKIKSRQREQLTPQFVSDQETIKKDIANTAWDPSKLNKWHYSSLNYIFLSGIVGKVYHESYEQAFTKTYIKRLGLKQSAFYWASPAKLKAIHWVPGHRDDGRINYNQQTLDSAHDELGAGSIVMSNYDLAQTLQQILAGSLLTKASRTALFADSPYTSYNGGFYNHKDYKSANGGGNGYYTFFRSTPNGSKMILIQTNHTRKGGFKQLKHRLNKIFPDILNLM